MPAPSGPELSIIVPTFNEQANVRELVDRITRVLDGVRWEIVFVDDDSPDETADVVRRLGRERSNVRCLQRIGRRGLSSACVEGALSSSAPYIAVMDADLQHDEAILPAMLDHLRSERVDVAVGSRYVDGGGTGEWSQNRVRISRLATRISSAIVPPDLKDPMSGFFMMRRDAFMNAVRHLSTLGFKILVDLFASSPRKLRFVEVPYEFRDRVNGESKLDHQVAWDFGLLLLDKTIGRWIPVRFVSFGLIGMLGLIVHMVVLYGLFKTASLGFATAQTVATLVAMTFNYSVNNLLTYRDRQNRGLRWWTGLLSFAVACSIGTLGNVGVANYLFNLDSNWMLSAVAGIVVGAVWNYAISSVYTWGPKK